MKKFAVFFLNRSDPIRLQAEKTTLTENGHLTIFTTKGVTVAAFPTNEVLGVVDESALLQGTSSAPAARNATRASNIADLASIIMSEASVGNAAERQAVGSTVLNRMSRNGTNSVEDVWDAYAHSQAPIPEITTLATNLVNGPLADNSNGSTHYYSPRSMPMEGDDTTGFDVGGGLEQTPGLAQRNYRPGWSTTYTEEAVADARPAYFKFYRQPGNGPVT